jgi:hypothetical protein
MKKLMVIAVDGGDLVALSPSSGIELARSWVMDETTKSHIMAAELLVKRAFESLNAEGYERASFRLTKKRKDEALLEAIREDAEMDRMTLEEEKEMDESLLLEEIEMDRIWNQERKYMESGEEVGFRQ